MIHWLSQDKTSTSPSARSSRLSSHCLWRYHRSPRSLFLPYFELTSGFRFLAASSQAHWRLSIDFVLWSRFIVSYFVLESHLLSFSLSLLESCSSPVLRVSLFNCQELFWSRLEGCDRHAHFLDGFSTLRLSEVYLQTHQARLLATSIRLGLPVSNLPTTRAELWILWELTIWL